MNFLWKIKILKTKNNYLIGYIFYVKETFKGVLCVCLCVYAWTDPIYQFILKIRTMKYPFIYCYDGNTA